MEPKWGWLEAVSVGLLALIGIDVLLSLVLGAGVGLLSPLLPNRQLENWLSSDSVVFNFIFYVVSRLLALGLIVTLLRRHGASIKELGFRSFKFGRGLWLVIQSSLALVVLTSATFWLIEKFLPRLNLDTPQDIVFTSASNIPELVLAAIALVVVAPIVEETIFRGFMLPPLIKRFGLGVGALTSSVLFAAVHWQLNVGIVTFIMGLLLARLVVKTNSLGPAIIFHSFKNLVAFVLIF